MWLFPKTRGPFLGVRMIRIIMSWVYVMAPNFWKPPCFEKSSCQHKSFVITWVPGCTVFTGDAEVGSWMGRLKIRLFPKTGGPKTDPSLLPSLLQAPQNRVPNFWKPPSPIQKLLNCCGSSAPAPKTTQPITQEASARISMALLRV